VTTQAGSPRWWRRARDLALAAARAAAAASAAAFLGLDTVQQHTGLQVEAYAALERGAAAERLEREWAVLRQRADAAVQDYLALTGRYDLEQDLIEPVAREAEAAHRQVEAALTGIHAEVTAFTGRCAAQFAQVEAALARLADGRARAARMLAEARAAIEAADGPAHEAADALAAAEQAAEVLSGGPAAHGLAAAVAAAANVVTQAGRARELAETLPAQRAQVDRTLSAVRTRADGIGNRLGTLPGVLTTLRRSFVAASFADVEKRPALAHRELAAAREALATAEAEAAARHLPRARAAIAAARTALDAAAGHANEVTGRLSALEAFAADRAAPVQATRFAVRQAQRLFLYRGDKVDQRYAGQLDGLMRRVDVVARELEAPRPDFWRLSRDLERIRAESAEVVQRLRGA